MKKTLKFFEPILSIIVFVIIYVIYPPIAKKDLEEMEKGNPSPRASPS